MGGRLQGIPTPPTRAGPFVAIIEPALARLAGVASRPDRPAVSGTAARDRLLDSLVETISALVPDQPHEEAKAALGSAASGQHGISRWVATPFLIQEQIRAVSDL